MFDDARRVTLSFGEVDPADIASLTADERAQLQLIDVREPNEWVDELGHIPGATLLPLADLLLSGPPPGTVPGRSRSCVRLKRKSRRMRAIRQFQPARGPTRAGGNDSGAPGIWQATRGMLRVRSPMDAA